MPVMDGFEVLERMSVAVPKVTSSVVVMTSAMLDGTDRRRLRRPYFSSSKTTQQNGISKHASFATSAISRWRLKREKKV
jgi:CheY-like chemotaxis protein